LKLVLSRTAHGAANAVSHVLDDGQVLHWELLEDAPADALLVAEVALDPNVEWVMRLDRVDFPPGGVAYRHTHPGPGIRYQPVLALASLSEPTAFVRTMLLPAEWRGKRTIRYVDPADDEKPKLQRAEVFLEQPVSR
jgi:hypothetical protein